MVVDWVHEDMFDPEELLPFSHISIHQHLILLAFRSPKLQGPGHSPHHHPTVLALSQQVMCGHFLRFWHVAINRSYSAICACVILLYNTQLRAWAIRYYKYLMKMQRKGNKSARLNMWIAKSPRPGLNPSSTPTSCWLQDSGQKHPSLGLPICKEECKRASITGLLCRLIEIMLSSWCHKCPINTNNFNYLHLFVVWIQGSPHNRLVLSCIPLTHSTLANIFN